MVGVAGPGLGGWLGIGRSLGSQTPTLGGVLRNFQMSDRLDFLAELAQFIPNTQKHLIRYVGYGPLPR